MEIILIENLIIERKTSKDFISSIFDVRLFNQANKISSYTNKAILLIEGNLNNEIEYIKNIINANPQEIQK